MFEFDHGRRVAQLCRRPWREADEAELISRDLGLLLLHTSSRFVSLGTDPCIGWGQNGAVHGQMIGIKLLARSGGSSDSPSSPLLSSPWSYSYVPTPCTVVVDATSVTV